MRAEPMHGRKPPEPEPDQPLVLICDDDAAVREGLSELLLSAGFTPAAFASTRDLLDAGLLDRNDMPVVIAAVRRWHCEGVWR